MWVLHGLESDRSVGLLDGGDVKGVVGGREGGFVLVVSVLGQELLLGFHLGRIGKFILCADVICFFYQEETFWHRLTIIKPKAGK